MMQRLFFMMIFFLSLSLESCSKEDDNNPSNSENNGGNNNLGTELDYDTFCFYPILMVDPVRIRGPFRVHRRV